MTLNEQIAELKGEGYKIVPLDLVISLAQPGMQVASNADADKVRDALYKATVLCVHRDDTRTTPILYLHREDGQRGQECAEHNPDCKTASWQTWPTKGKLGMIFMFKSTPEASLKRVLGDKAKALELLKSLGEAT